jgi:uncharacterized protein (DUF58 family)
LLLPLLLLFFLVLLVLLVLLLLLLLVLLPSLLRAGRLHRLLLQPNRARGVVKIRAGPEWGRRAGPGREEDVGQVGPSQQTDPWQALPVGLSQARNRRAKWVCEMKMKASTLAESTGQVGDVGRGDEAR